MSPAISVVVPAYKAEAFIARAVTSLLEQPDVRLEIIVVVDGVYDRTAAIAARFPGVAVLVNEENRGAPAARNRGLAVASAPFVLFLDADDYVEGPLLSELVATAEEQALDLVFGPVCKEWPDGRRDFIRLVPSGDRMEILYNLVAGHMVPPCSVLWRREFLCRIGGWRQGLLRFQDVELALRGMLRTPNVAYASTKGCGVYSQHDGPRITSRRTHQSLRSAFDVLSWLQTELSSQGKFAEPMRKALRSRVYGCMALSYAWGLDEVAEEFALKWRELGAGKHEGTFLHRLMCNIVGLRWKQRLSGSRFMSSLRGARRVIVRHVGRSRHYVAITTTYQSGSSGRESEATRGRCSGNEIVTTSGDRMHALSNEGTLNRVRAGAR